MPVHVSQPQLTLVVLLSLAVRYISAIQVLRLTAAELSHMFCSFISRLNPQLCQ